MSASTAIRQAAARAVATLPGTTVTAAVFAEALAERATTVDSLDELNVPDLLLAFAALQKDAAGLRELDRRAEACVKAARRREHDDDEVLQLVRHRLLVGSAATGPALARYSGKGALVKWLKTVVVSVTVDEARKSKPDRNAGEDALATAASTEAGAEMALMHARYKADFTSAFTEALSQLTPQERTVLRMRFVDGLDIGDVGRTFGVHRTTALRWMEKAFATVLEHTRSLLSARLKLSAPEIDSLLRSFDPSLNDRLSRLLAKVP